MWGHYTSRDMIDWEYQGVTLYRISPLTAAGYIQGALLSRTEKCTCNTGNVKLEDRDDYDYVNSGREANTVLVTSTDGGEFRPEEAAHEKQRLSG